MIQGLFPSGVSGSPPDCKPVLAATYPVSNRGAGWIGIDQQGNVYLDYGNAVEKRNSKLELVWSNPSDVYNRGFDVDVQGNMYLADLRKLYKYNSTGTQTMAFTYYDSSDNLDASGLVVDLNGNIFIAMDYDDGSKCLVKKFDSSGNKKWSFGDGVLNNTVSCMEVDSLGNVYFAGRDKKLRKINSAGTQVWVASASSIASFLAVDIEGNIILGAGGETEKFSGSDGTKLWNTYQGGAMTVDLLGNVYLMAQWFVKLNKNGERTYRVSRGNLGIEQYASSMAVDLQGNIWMTMQMDSNVYKLTQTADAVLCLAADKETPILCKSIQKNGTDYYVR